MNSAQQKLAEEKSKWEARLSTVQEEKVEQEEKFRQRMEMEKKKLEDEVVSKNYNSIMSFILIGESSVGILKNNS